MSFLSAVMKVATGAVLLIATMGWSQMGGFGVEALEGRDARSMNAASAGQHGKYTAGDYAIPCKYKASDSFDFPDFAGYTSDFVNGDAARMKAAGELNYWPMQVVRPQTNGTVYVNEQ